MNIYIIISFGGLLGIILHAFKSIASINKANPNTNFRMVYTQFWKSDWLTVAGSFLCFFALLFVSSEFINYRDVAGQASGVETDLKDKLIHFQIKNFIKVVSVIAGYFADSIVYGFLGVTAKKLEKRFETENTTP